MFISELPDNWGSFADPVQPNGRRLDVTEAFDRLPRQQRARMLAEIAEYGYTLDVWDALKRDPKSPEWVRRSCGAFCVQVRS
jgi:hypothetical protein